MRTNINLAITLVIFIQPVYGQLTSSLPQDEMGKITFAEVVQVEGVSKDLLYQNAHNYLTSLVENSKGLKKSSLEVIGNQELYLPLHFNVYHEFPIKSPHGIIKYDLNVSLKDGRYRYVASNFVFYYLKRNRYGKFVEVNGKSKPLEEPFFKGNQKLWDQHKTKVSEKVTGLAETLKAVMLIPDGGPKKEIVKVNSDW
ncbi:MAG: DUF4468 domain-containing protein [Cyclobacteriaceae bacterium]|nr:DUF4468 domain-containing protein [Cyclobacteriaceae bacterium]